MTTKPEKSGAQAPIPPRRHGYIVMGADDGDPEPSVPPVAQNPGAESAHSGVGAPRAAGAEPLSGSLRFQAPAGTLVRLQCAELPLEQRDRILPRDGRVDLEFPSMERCELIGTPFSRAALVLELLKSGNVICAISELEGALRDARAQNVSERVPANVLELLLRLQVAAVFARGRDGTNVVAAFNGVTVQDLESLSRGQCVQVVEHLAKALHLLRSAV
jgi:hypothetical protein